MNYTTKKITLLLFMSTILTGMATADFEGGDGSPNNPYQISTCQQLQNMQNDLDANYELVNNVDCSGYSGFSSFGDWSNGFTGVLDGQDYVVENLKISESAPTSEYVGMIGLIRGQVKNIGVVDADITGTKFVGALAGYIDGGSVSGSYSTGSVSGSLNVGGLVGYNYLGSVSGSYSNANVAGSSRYAGGLLGRNFGDLSSSYATGSVSGGGSIGGLVGDGSGSVSNSYWDVETSGQSDSDGGTGLTTSEMSGRTPLCDGTMSGLDFSNTWFTRSGDYPGLRAFESNPSNLNCLPNASFSFTPSNPSIGEPLTLDASGSSDPNGDSLSYSWSGDVSGSGSSISKTFYSPGDKTITLTVSDGNGGSDSITKDITVDAFAGGDGSSSNPFQISTCQQLQDMQNDLDSYYELMNSVSCGNFDPIGNSSVGFGGVLNGQGYTVDNLTIDMDGSSRTDGTNSVGLIGRLDSGGKVYDVGATNANISGNKNVGVLVGDNNGVVHSSYSSGYVKANRDAGGLVGDNNGDVIASYSSTDVSTNDKHHDNKRMGGLVGKNLGEVIYSYSTGNVESWDHVGGLVGNNQNSVSFSYSTGSTQANRYLDPTWEGGLIGFGDRLDSCVSDSYWDTATSGISTGIGTNLERCEDGATGLNTNQMTYPNAESSMNFDFSGTWLRDDNNINSGYPILCWQERENCPPVVLLSVSNSSPEVNESVTFNASGSVDPNGDSLSYSWSGDVSGSGPSISKTFTSRGDKTVTLTVSNGNGGSNTRTETVSVVNSPPNASLSYTPSTTVIGESITFNASGSVDPNGDSLSYSWSGDVSGSGPTVSESFTSLGKYSATVTVSDGNGGSDTVTKVVPYGFVGGNGSSGNPFQISTCTQLQGMNEYLDAHYELVSNVDCSSFGGFSSIGGFPSPPFGGPPPFSGVLDGQGYMVQNLTPRKHGLIEYLDNDGEIKNIGLVNVDVDMSNYKAGGLVGVHRGSINNSFTTGEVSAESTVGGLVGDNRGGSISNSFSTASVSGDGYTGGLAGDHSGSISNSFSTGTVPSASYNGGLIGGYNEQSLSNNYWDTVSSGISSSPGGTGLSTSQMTYPNAKSNMSGLDFSNIWQRDLAASNSGYPFQQVFCGDVFICNPPPDANLLKPTGRGVEYGPTISATYNDPDDDTGNITFYNSSSGSQIGSTQTGLSNGSVASVNWSSADTPGTEFNFTAEASDGISSTNATQNFTTIFQPEKPFDPFPANNSLIDTTTSSGNAIAASVEVAHPDNRDMNVKFINATDGSVIYTDFSVASGTRAELPNLNNNLRDQTGKTYEWYARAVDSSINPSQKSESSIYRFSTPEVGSLDFDFQTGRDENVDITGDADNGNEEIRIGVESTLLDPIPKILVNDSSGNLIKSFNDVSNNSVITVDVVQDGGQDWNLQADQAYEWSIAAFDGPNKIRDRGPFDLYTYNISGSWDRSTKDYNVFEYDVYRAPGSTAPYDPVVVKADTSFIDAGPDLEPGKFCWKVAASNPQGESQRIPSGGVCKTLN